MPMELSDATSNGFGDGSQTFYDLEKNIFRAAIVSSGAHCCLGHHLKFLMHLV